ncbi:bacteriohemerythrin [Ottowia thiooxydans]|uniref:bacteriohemerythrin n=1 Tax=Ottowia thiooxydans TaxID=219182 RepID=UPI00048F59E3|nr:hemerythrin domain-containing protein [Ottowia thiooxydans]
MHTSTQPMDWSDSLLVGHPAMDCEHQAFTRCVNAMLTAGDAHFAEALQAMAEHLAEHFALEERLIDEHRFPAGACHAEEHAKVRASVREVQALVAAGDMEIGRELAQALVDWFPGHAEQMDSALAIWVARKTLGGAPVVLRRDLRALAPSA